ncbi:MAG: GtrA family protein [Clostridia bacterium]|nr:GtrA family protein [Clostridia bacterium]
MEKLKKLIKKIWSKEVIFYLIFGVLTTLVNIVVSYVLKSFCHMEGNLASTIGIITSILFAYFTNRKWVFISQANTAKAKLIEFGKFMLGRAFTMVIEIVGVFLLNNVIHSFYGIFSDNIAYLINKVLITIIVIILNFFISKFFAFKKVVNVKN